MAEGVRLEPVVPMKKWKVKFDGEMIMKNEGDIITSHKVRIDAEYNSELEYFDFDSDMDPWTVARAMAREPWSRQYFERLKAAHQSHYEQFGEVTGLVSVDGQERALKVSVMRDHTHGSNRDWTLMHRYCLHNFTCQDGTRGFLGVVSQPGNSGRDNIVFSVFPQEPSPSWSWDTFMTRTVRNIQFRLGLSNMCRVKVNLQYRRLTSPFGTLERMVGILTTTGSGSEQEESGINCR